MNASSAVLVTGATGFIGSHLMRRLVEGRTGEAGDGEVRVLVRPGRDRGAWNGNGARVMLGDLTDSASLDAAVAGCDTVYHLAAATSRLTARSLAEYAAVNRAGTVALLDACRRAGVRHVVLCSSSGVYGRLATWPIGEDGPLRADTLYRRSKLDAERAIWPLLGVGAPTVAIARPAAVYGPGSVNWLPLFRDIAQDRFRLIGDGRHPYHCTHVDDIVSGLVRCAQPQAAGRIYNLAARDCPTLLEVLETIADVLGVPFNPRRVPAWPFRTPVHAAAQLVRSFSREPAFASRIALFTEPRAYDVSRAVRELAYSPRVSLRDGIESMAAWFRSRGELT